MEHNILNGSSPDETEFQKTGDDPSVPKFHSEWPLDGEEYQRYGRQLIMPEVGLEGQLRLKHSSILIVGVGGLGCPAAAYLAGAGVGSLGLIDGDTVEMSNLHRQILHSTSTVGISKVASAILRLKDTNPLVNYYAHDQSMQPETAIDIIRRYDLILDCTDHPTSRYLISDACVVARKPLVSASALRMDGQLTVFNDPPAPAGDSSGGPCYRCVWPKPPPAESVTGCGDGGILGPVVGMMGVMMAFESIKMITSGSVPISNDESLKTVQDYSASKDKRQSSMLLFSGLGPRIFQSVKLPGRRAGCPACSAEATISADSLTGGSLDYVQFCGATAPVHVLNSEQRITATRLSEMMNGKGSLEGLPDCHILIDVREKVHFDLCRLPGSINIPFSELMESKTVKELPPQLKFLFNPSASTSEESFNFQNGPSSSTNMSITFICRLGNDSQFAVKKLQDLGINGDRLVIKDLEGGLRAWRLEVDKDWPDY